MPIPTNPATVVKNVRQQYNSGSVDYWVMVPTPYDATHNTPMKLYVWLHGCGGNSIYDVVDTATLSSSQTYITMAPGGAEGACWFSNGSYAAQSAKILSAIADIKTRYNISASQVFIGGYSSGGDIGYPILFQNSTMFAGGLFVNTSPRGDGSGVNGIAAGQSSTFKGHIYHVAHTGDNTDNGAYSPASVTADMATLTASGWTATCLERSSSVQFPYFNDPHYKATGANENDGDSSRDRTVVGTLVYDILNYLLPHINDGWTNSSGGSGGSTTPPGTFASLVANVPGSRPILQPLALRSGTKHGLSFSAGSNSRIYLSESKTLSAGASFFAAFKTTSTDTVASQTINCPLTLFGYNSTPTAFAVGMLAGTPRYHYTIAGNPNFYQAGSVTTLNDGNMHTMAWTHSTLGALNCYVDGVLVGTWAGVTYDPTANINIIGGGYLDTDCFEGTLAEAMVWNGELTAQDIRNLNSRANSLWF